MPDKSYMLLLWLQDTRSDNDTITKTTCASGSWTACSTGHSVKETSVPVAAAHRNSIQRFRHRHTAKRAYAGDIERMDIRHSSGSAAAGIYDPLPRDEEPFGTPDHSDRVGELACPSPPSMPQLPLLATLCSRIAHELLAHPLARRRRDVPEITGLCSREKFRKETRM
jgi:hypothetical protein